jgi:alcohol dehydrogenase (cytochrome c)
MRHPLLLASLSASLWGPLYCQGVTFDRILNADKEPQNWLTYSGAVNGQRHSELKQITPANAKNLELQWVWQSKSLEKYETTSLVVDGVLYTVEAPDTVVALDATTGKTFWTFPYTPAADARPCCGRVNRGLAILGDTIFMGTIDAHLIAIDAATGKQVWNTEIPTPAETPEAKGRYGVTHAPLVVKDKVIVGTTGGDGGIRGYIDAYDAKTGKQAWRFYTIPAPGEPGNESWPPGDRWKTGGGAVWQAGAYDPESNLTFWGIGNPSGTHNPDQRVGDNLYTDSVVALDADTGKLKWYYQFTPHDDMDWDSTQVPVLADIEWQGKPRKVMLWANRNGIMYVLDRASGQFLSGKAFVQANWLSGFDEKGRPMRVPGKVATPEGSFIMPTMLGATNWYPPSFSPSTGLFYIPGWENAGVINYLGKTSKDTGVTPMADVKLAPNYRTDAEGFGVVRAFDPKTGEKKWEYKMGDTTWAGVLTTAGDVLFSGGREGYFYALNARTGEMLWKVPLGGQINSGAMSYSVNGKQYVAVAAGTSLFAFALR